jgi:hypothetical protein
MSMSEELVRAEDQGEAQDLPSVHLLLFGAIISNIPGLGPAFPYYCHFVPNLA